MQKHILKHAYIKLNLFLLLNSLILLKIIFDENYKFYFIKPLNDSHFYYSEIINNVKDITI